MGSGLLSTAEEIMMDEKRYQLLMARIHATCALRGTFIWCGAGMPQRNQ